MSTAPADETELAGMIRLRRSTADELGHVSALLHAVARRFGVDGDDVAQETFLKALALGDPGLSIGWFSVACRRLLIDRLRQERRRRATPLDGCAEPRDDRPQPLEAGIEREMLINLREAFTSLPPLDQEILELTAFKGLDCRQAAEELGISHVAARRRRHEAMKRCRKAIGGAESHD